MDDLVERLRKKAFRGPTMEAAHTKTLEWKAADRIEALEAEVLRIGDVLDNVPSVNVFFLEWPHTDKAPPEFAERLLRAWGKIAIETLRNSEYHKLLRAKYTTEEKTDD
jgi:hypothetical protein